MCMLRLTTCSQIRCRAVPSAMVAACCNAEPSFSGPADMWQHNQASAGMLCLSQAHISCDTVTQCAYK